jgi:hypothetical protein
MRNLKIHLLGITLIRNGIELVFSDEDQKKHDENEK